jgi:cytochrome c oxidase subunit 2
MVSFLMVWFVVKFKGTNTTKATSDVTHNTPLELTWTIIPLILVIAIFYVGMEGYLNLRQAPVGAYEVQVTGARWSWNFRHRNGVNESNVLLVPANRPVKLIMDSSDVLHAAYIPAFRVKQDIVPGRITTLWFQATEPGDYDLFCAEYCGKDHSQMHAVVQVREEAEFQAELLKRSEIFKDKPLEVFPILAIQKIYPRCKSCHSLDENVTTTAPSWRGLWAKLEKGEELFTDGSKLADHIGEGKLFTSPEDYVRRSILDPQQKIVANYTGSMPTFAGQLKDLEIQAIIELLKRLDEFDNNGVPKPGTPAAQQAAELKAKAGG